MSVATKVTLTVLTVAALGGGSVTLWAWKGRTADPPAAARFIRSRPNRWRSRAEAPAVVAEPRALPPEPAGQARSPARDPATGRDSGRGATTRNPGRAWLPRSAAAPALEPLSPELTVLRQAQADLRAGLPASGPAPAGGLRPPFWQGSSGRRTPSRRGHRPLSGGSRTRGREPGRSLSTKRA